MPKTAERIQITEEERELLRAARRDGVVSASLFERGEFSEEGFLRFGKLEVLCLKGFLKFVDRIGRNERAPGEERMIFALAETAACCM